MRLRAFLCGRVKTLRKDDRLRVDGDKNMGLLAFAFTIVFVWTGLYIYGRFVIEKLRANFFRLKRFRHHY